MSDWTPPQDTTAEASVLGAMLTRPATIPDVCAVLRGADYYRPNHEAIHDAIVDLHARGEAVDMVTVAAELTSRGSLQRVGGAPYLHTLASEVPAPGHAERYAELVADKAMSRRLVAAGQQVTQLGLEATDTTQAAEDARQLVDAAAATVRNDDGGTTMAEGLDAALDWLETAPEGADTPWADVNERTNGLLAGSMVTVAARPGHGKSLCLKDVAVFTAKQDKPVHIATLEMSRHEYMARILSAETGVDLGRMLRRQMSDADWQRVGRASEQVRQLPLYLDDREAQTMAQIRAGARATQRRYGRKLGLIGIDYAQLVKPRDMRLPREQQVAEISRQTKLLAKEFQCPVLLLAQLNRGNTARTDPRPMPSDLRESGALEQDSDQVWLLHRPDQYGDDERLGEVDLIVGKNRNGPAPIAVPLAFQGHYGRLASLA